jgi:hypothetical protein
MSLSSTGIPACARLVLCAFSVASADALLQRKQRAQARMPVLQILACYRACVFGVASADALLQRKQRAQARMPVPQILSCYRALVHRDAKAGR